MSTDNRPPDTPLQAVVISSSNHWMMVHDQAEIESVCPDFPEKLAADFKIIVDRRFSDRDVELLWDRDSFLQRYREQKEWDEKSLKESNGRPVWSGPRENPTLYVGAWRAWAKLLTKDDSGFGDAEQKKWSLVVQNGFSEPVFDTDTLSGSILGWEMVRAIAESIIAVSEEAEEEAWQVIQRAARAAAISPTEPSA